MPDFVTLAPDVVLRVINGEALLLKLTAEDVFALNDTGTRIVQLLGEGRDLDAVVDALHGEYGVPPVDLRQAVTDLVDALRARGLVVVRREAAPGV
jgi:Coenzyme PQQ synthesis protein D (PqqD)